MLLTTNPTAITEQQVLDYALDPANQERFAELLEKILPAYTTWVWGKDNAYRRYFNRWQQAGFNLAPNHYYSPIPDVARLTAKLLDARSEMVGIDWRQEEQRRFLREICSTFRAEYEQFPDRATRIPHQFFLINGAFGPVDAEVLHSMIRHYQPRRVIEIGSGCSTLATAAALEINRRKNGRESHFTAIEPYPGPTFLNPIPGLTELLQCPLEDVDLALFQELQENDVLFIDSTHAVKCGGDVNRIYLEILPRIRAGVVIHVHDIFLPAEYPKKWLVDEHVFWTEQYLLQAFLAFNQEFEVLWSGSYMHMEHSDELALHIPSYRNDAWPGSFWMRRRTQGSKSVSVGVATSEASAKGSGPMKGNTAASLSPDVFPPANASAYSTKPWPWADSSVKEARRLAAELTGFDKVATNDLKTLELRTNGLDWPDAMTMIGMKRMQNIFECISIIMKNNTAGDFMECGIWRGGAVIFMRSLLDTYQDKDRIVWGADSFEGVPPDEMRLCDDDKGVVFGFKEYLGVPQSKVEENLRKYGFLNNRVKLIPGWFKDTLHNAPVRKLALLRLDGDLYESTMDELNALYHKVVPGGFVIVDDYGLKMCKKAVDEFRESQGIKSPLKSVDWTGVYWQK
jgi:hypothetical protein